MRPWDEIVRNALLGTERQPFAVPASPGPVAEVVARLGANGNPGEAALLSAAATVAAYAQAGHSGAQLKEDAPAPCEAESLPACSPGSAAHLTRLLAGEHATALPEWLAACAKAGRRVPHPQLVDLLEAGRSRPEVRDALLPVLGQRGTWLMAQNPEWQYATTALDESVWQTGSRPERLSLLKQFRRRDPDRARDLLSTTWADEPPDERGAMIQVLGEQLSDRDEPFLEAALDDRRKEVRRAASEFLARLTTSALVRRMTERFDALVTLAAGKKGGLLSRGTKLSIDVTLPKECDKAMQRDGVEPKSTQRMGEKHWWLVQVVAAVPPAVWIQKTGATPAEVVAAVGKTDYAKPLLEGLALSAARQRDPAWSGELFAARKDWDETAEKLFDSLPPERREDVALEALGHAKPFSDERTVHVLAACRHPWSAKLSKAFLDALRAHTTRSGGMSNAGWQLIQALPALGLYLNPSALPATGAGWPAEQKDAAYWRSYVDRMLGLLQFRHDMLRELQS